MKKVKGQIEWEKKLRNVQHPQIHLQDCIKENRDVIEILLKEIAKLKRSLEIK